jgi:hypothetical protein
LNIDSFDEAARELHAEFLLRFDENEPDYRVIASLTQSYLELVQDDWVQINEKKVLYADRRLKYASLTKRGDMTEEETTVQFKEWVLRDKSNFLQAMSIYQVLVPKLKGAKKIVVWERKELPVLWLQWRGRTTFDRCVFQPKSENVKAGEFNLWTPYAVDEDNAWNFVKRRGWDRKRVLLELKPWLNHMFHIISDGYRNHFRYIISWKTWILRNKSKAGTALLLMSDHGAGKSCVAEAYAEILGPTHACTLTKADELTGTFNAHLGFKNLVISEEATYGGSKKDQGNLKNLVTAKTINIRPLYQSLMVMESRHNLIIISNLNRHVIPIEPTERRYACFYPNGKYAGIQTPEAKRHFDAVLNVPTPLIAYFHYFIWDMKDFNPRLDIPVTACTTDQKIKSIDNSSRFVLTKLQTMNANEWNNFTEFLTFPQFYAEFIGWCDEAKINSWQRETLQTFVDSTKRHLLVTRRRIGSGTQTDVFLVRNLARQRLAWATSIGLPKFPSLQRAIDPTADDGDESKEGGQTYMDLVLDEGLSDDERDKLIDRVAKRRRVTRKVGCPPTCNRKHPAFVHMTPSGDYEVCKKGDKGATRWHDVPDAHGSSSSSLAPVFVTADVSIS